MDDGKMNNDGVGLLGRVLQQRMQKVSEQPTALELGTIQPGGGLRTDSFAAVIPAGSYLVCRQLTQPFLGAAMWESAQAWYLKPGNRVLVAWIGAEAVVVDLVKSSAEI